MRVADRQTCRDRLMYQRAFLYHIGPSVPEKLIQLVIVSLALRNKNEIFLPNFVLVAEAIRTRIKNVKGNVANWLAFPILLNMKQYTVSRPAPHVGMLWQEVRTNNDSSEDQRHFSAGTRY